MDLILILDSCREHPFLSLLFWMVTFCVIVFGLDKAIRQAEDPYSNTKMETRLLLEKLEDYRKNRGKLELIQGIWFSIFAVWFFGFLLFYASG